MAILKTITLTAAVAGVVSALPGNLTQLKTRSGVVKKGLAYNDGSITDLLYADGSVSWAYNWGIYFAAPKFEQVPMIKFLNPKPNEIDIVMERVKNKQAPWVMGYNEPDETTNNGGIAKSPREAYDAWGNDMFRFNDAGASLVCPGITSWETTAGHVPNVPAGLTWLREFASIGNNPSQFRCEAQNIHWYGNPDFNAMDQANMFKEYVAHAHATINDIFRKEMPLWITEFAPLPRGNRDLMAQFLTIVVPWLEQQSYVARYSPFMAEDLVDNGARNAAGRAFVCL
jgi:hypothetical protein